MDNATVLIVDDDPASRETLADLLSVESYDIVTAADGKTLFDYLEVKAPDVILLDVMMPRLNGFEICKMLKSNERWSHIPVVLITALNDRRSLLQGLEVGANEFLSKPISGPELRARVRNMVQLKRQHDALQTTIRLQDDLVRIVVHDMRSPLSTISLQTSSLLYKNPQETEKKSLQSIDAEAGRLDSYFDNLLILIKQDKENLRLRFSDVNLEKMVRKAIEERNQLAAAAEVAIHFQSSIRDEPVSLDANLFRRVVDNLLSYAIKRSPRGGVIEVKLSKSEPAESDTSAFSGPQGIRLTIADQGSRISAERRDKIFDMVEIITLKREGDFSPDIGLAFCKKVVEQHSGKIFVSDNYPEGAVFVVDI